MAETQTFCEQCGTLLDVQLGCTHCSLAEGLDAGAHDTRIEEQIGRLREVFPAYDWKERVGQGGMGVVYRAVHRRLDRTVAVKVLNPALEQQAADFGKRFEREARTMASLSHPGLVTVHDFGVEQGFYVLFMEFVEGATLRQVLRDGRLQPHEALDIVRQVCDALEYAHERGVVHRDIKPENILIDERGHVKITDFGLARLVGDQRGLPTLTRSQQVMGTPHYMAPEQMQAGSRVDLRADIFSLGVVFYELLTGSLPVGRFPPPSTVKGSDPALDELVMKSLEPDPDARFSDVASLRQAVQGVSGGLAPVTVGSPRIGRAADPPPSTGQALLHASYTLVGMLCLAGFASMMMPWYEHRLRRPAHPVDADSGVLGLIGFCLVMAFVIMDWFGLIARRESPQDADTISYSRWMDRLRWPFFALGSAMAAFGCGTLMAQERMTESGVVFGSVSVGSAALMLLVSQIVCLRPLLPVRRALSLSQDVARRLQWASIALCALAPFSVYLAWDWEWKTPRHDEKVFLLGYEDSRCLMISAAFLAGFVILAALGSRRVGAARFLVPLSIGAGSVALCATFVGEGLSGPMIVLPLGGALFVLAAVVLLVGVRAPEPVELPETPPPPVT